MIFNNQILKSNLLGSCYLSGTLAFAGDQLYSPVNNMVKRIDMSNNSTEVLPFENNHQTKLLQISPDGVILVAIDMAGYAVVFNLKGSFVVAEFNFKGVISMATFS